MIFVILNCLSFECQVKLQHITRAKEKTKKHDKRNSTKMPKDERNKSRREAYKKKMDEVADNKREEKNRMRREAYAADNKREGKI